MKYSRLVCVIAALTIVGCGKRNEKLVPSDEGKAYLICVTPNDPTTQNLDLTVVGPMLHEEQPAPQAKGYCGAFYDRGAGDLKFLEDGLFKDPVLHSFDPEGRLLKTALVKADSRRYPFMWGRLPKMTYVPKLGKGDIKQLYP